MTSRRDFIERATLSALALSAPAPAFLRHLTGDPPPRGFLDIMRPPDRVLVETASGDLVLASGPTERWAAPGGVVVNTAVQAGALRVTLASPSVGIRRVQLRWRGRFSGSPSILGDAWERAYGDLEWRGWVPDRVMPWYFAMHDAAGTHCYGVRTSPGAFCSWQVDPDGISLWADVRSGSAPVALAERTLDVCDVISRAGRAGESAFAALHAFCRGMCPAPLMPPDPVYGSNDWYSVYGGNSDASVRADAGRIVELSPTGSNRPFAVIDDGWQPGGGHDLPGAGIWDRSNEKFPDMAALAAAVRGAGARPGIWIRPLQAAADTPAGWRLSRDRESLDPTVPETLHKVAQDIARLREWGFELIKHDYSTWDIFGRWGFQMGASLTKDGWTFAEGPRRTSAEVIDALYRTIRTAAGPSLLIGCNTVSHLSAGRFEICRIGDDTSGTEWPRTRKMGVNSLAFRGVQHGALYVADPDCVGVTTAVPWALNRQWLDLVARSGTMLSVSLAADALGAEQRRDLKAALAMAAAKQPLGQPLDWERAAYPARWRLMGRERSYDWVGQDGAGAL
jgi:alpha-galactosidase